MRLWIHLSVDCWPPDVHFMAMSRRVSPSCIDSSNWRAEWSVLLVSIEFVVTGTGRSGTAYAAALFTAAGLPCGHEGVFNDKLGLLDRGAPRRGLLPIVKAPAGRLKEEMRRSHSTLRGDASWMAVPRLPRFQGKSFLQLRHPLLVIRSFVGTRFFSDVEAHHRQRNFAAAHFEIRGEDVIDAMRWWVHWNRLAVPFATRIYQLEALDIALLSDLLGVVGVDQTASRAEIAFASVPGDVNSSARRGCQPGAIEWADLPSGCDKLALEGLALRFGYDLESPTVSRR